MGSSYNMSGADKYATSNVVIGRAQNNDHPREFTKPGLEWGKKNIS